MHRTLCLFPTLVIALITCQCSPRSHTTAQHTNPRPWTLLDSADQCSGNLQGKSPPLSSFPLTQKPTHSALLWVSLTTTACLYHCPPYVIFQLSPRIKLYVCLHPFCSNNSSLSSTLLTKKCNTLTNLPICLKMGLEYHGYETPVFTIYKTVWNGLLAIKRSNSTSVQHHGWIYRGFYKVK